MQKEGWKGLTGLEKGKTCKNLGGKRQKFDEWACPSRREKEKFEKDELNTSNLDFLKTLFTIFDWSKISFDWSKQTETY